MALSLVEIVILGLYLAILAALIVYLTVRAVVARNHKVLLLALAFAARLVVQLAEYLPGKYIIRGLLDFDDVLFIIVFTKITYHLGKKSHFMTFFLIVLAIRVFVGVLVIGFQFDIPNTWKLAGSYLAIYEVYLACGSFMTWVGYGWLVWSAFSAIKQRSDQQFPSWFRFRNECIGIGYAFFLVFPLGWFLYQTNGTGYQETSLGTIVLLILAIPTFASLLFNAVAWITPRFILDRFDREHNMDRAALKREISEAVETEEKALDAAVSEKVLNQRGILDLIGYLGDYLATLIDKPPNAAKGLIFVSIVSQLGDPAAYVMRLKQILEVINGTLLARLNAMNVKNPDEIVKKMRDKIVDDQSMLIMMAI